MKNLIRRWLGLDNIETHLYDIRNNRLDDRKLLNAVQLSVQTSNRLHAAILAKLSPGLAVPEDDPERRAASDRLSDAIIKRIQGEVKASNPINFGDI